MAQLLQVQLTNFVTCHGLQSRPGKGVQSPSLDGMLSVLVEPCLDLGGVEAEKVSPFDKGGLRS